MFKKILIIGLLMFPSAAQAMSFQEFKQKLKQWRPGDHIPCEMVQFAYGNLAANYVDNIAKKKGASKEDIDNKKASCGVK